MPGGLRLIGLAGQLQAILPGLVVRRVASQDGLCRLPETPPTATRGVPATLLSSAASADLAC
jgi:hypothetical protein